MLVRRIGSEVPTGKASPLCVAQALTHLLVRVERSVSPCQPGIPARSRPVPRIDAAQGMQMVWLRPPGAGAEPAGPAPQACTVKPRAPSGAAHASGTGSWAGSAPRVRRRMPIRMLEGDVLCGTEYARGRKKARTAGGCSPLLRRRCRQGRAAARRRQGCKPGSFRKRSAGGRCRIPGRTGRRRAWSWHHAHGMPLHARFHARFHAMLRAWCRAPRPAPAYRPPGRCRLPRDDGSCRIRASSLPRCLAWAGRR